MLKKLFLCLGLLSVATYAKAPDGLIRAISRQDIDSVQNFLETDPTLINAKDKYNRSVLELAVNTLNYEIIFSLVERGANVNIDALSTAIKKYNHVEIVEYLLDHNSDIIDDQDAKGKTPLEVAINDSNLDVIKLLVEYGAEVNPKVLFDTIKRNDIKVMECLLDQIPNMIDDKNAKGLTPLEVAINDRNLDIIKSLVETYGAEINLKALLTAIENEKFDFDIVKYLLGRVSDDIVNAEESGTGRTPLVVALTNRGDLGLVKLLVKEGAKVNLKALVEAIRSNNVNLEVVKYLLDRIPEDQIPDIINKKYCDEWTPLLAAISYKGDLDLVKLLIERGAKVTPEALVMAVRYDKVSCNEDLDLKVLRYLLNQNSDIINDENDEGMSPLLAALRYRKILKIVCFLVERGAKVNFKALMTAITNDNEENVVYFLLTQIPNNQIPDIINATDKEGRTLLEMAISGENLSIVSLLDRYRAKVNFDVLQMAMWMAVKKTVLEFLSIC